MVSGVDLLESKTRREEGTLSERDKTWRGKNNKNKLTVRHEKKNEIGKSECF